MITVNYATQGVELTQVFTALQNLLVATTELSPRRVLQWFDSGRPAIEGADTLIWYCLDDAGFRTSPGPGRYGNTAELEFTINIETRMAQGKSQVDASRLISHYETYWKVLQALQNQMLFGNYTPVQVEYGDPWVLPVPAPDSNGETVPYTVATMLCQKVPGGSHTQKEEYTLASAVKLLVPVCLKLIVRSTL